MPHEKIHNVVKHIINAVQIDNRQHNEKIDNEIIDMMTKEPILNNMGTHETVKYNKEELTRIGFQGLDSIDIYKATSQGFPFTFSKGGGNGPPP